MPSIFNYPKFHAETALGLPLVGGKVYTYAPGTTTPKASYQDAAMSAANTNPVILDANGDAVIYLSGVYDVVLKDSSGVSQWTMSSVTGGNTSDDYEVDVLYKYGGGTTYTQAVINLALVAVGTSTKTTLLFRPGTWVISSDANWSAYTNVVWKFAPGAIWQIATGTTTTIAGAVDIGDYQVFSCAGTGSVVFGASSVKEAYPEWWKTNTAPGTTDMTAAITSALASTRRVFLRDTAYLISSPITVSQGKQLIGKNRDAAKIQNNGADSALIVTYSTSEELTTIADLYIRGNATPSGQHGVEFSGSGQSAAYVEIKNVRISNCGGHGIYGGHEGHVNTIEIAGCSIKTNYGDGINLQYGTDVTLGTTTQINAIWIHHNDITYNKGVGIRFYGNNVVVESNGIQANESYGISVGDDETISTVKYALGSTIRDNYFEGNDSVGTSTERAVIAIFSGYTSASKLYIIRDISIQNNYFVESGSDYRSMIYCKDLVGNTVDTYSTARIHTINNYTLLPLIYFDTNTTVSKGTTFKESSSSIILTDAVMDTLPVYVEVYGRIASAAPTISYTNSWVAAYSPFYTLNGCIVSLNGGIKDGTVGAGTPAFTLPKYLRPTTTKYFAVITKSTLNTLGCVKIHTDGTVTVITGDNSLIMLDGITYDKRF